MWKEGENEEERKIICNYDANDVDNHQSVGERKGVSDG